MRRLVLSGLVAAAAAAVAAAQSPQLSFDVASIKENKSADNSGNFGIMPPTPGRYRAVNTPLRFILQQAFGVMHHQLIGAPEWTESVDYDITATYEGAVRSEDDMRAMLRTLLADRFGLKTHRETRELPIYALVMARKDGALGPQLVRSSLDCERVIAEQRAQTRAGRAGRAAAGGTKRPMCQLQASRRSIVAGTRTMEHLVGPLQSLTGRPVINRTGLTGGFDFDLK